MNANRPDRNETEVFAEDAFESVIRDGGMNLFPADTRVEVERILMPGQATEPGARGRLVDAARRGALARSAGQRPVERLLFDSRRALNWSIEDVAKRAGAEAPELASVERGEARITELDPVIVASWIDALGIDGRTAISALTTSLSVTSASPAYAANPTSHLEPDDAKFVTAVVVALGLDNTTST